MNIGTTVTLASNGRQAGEGQPQPSQPSGQPEEQDQAQAPSSQPNGASQTPGQGTPRVIRITHQTMEPVVMMQMNLDGKSLLKTVFAGSLVRARVCVCGFFQSQNFSLAIHSWSDTI